MTRATSWKEALQEQMPPDWAHEIDVFEGQMELTRQGRLEAKVFAETRLRRGTYGQRYDNGQRHDGESTRTIAYPRTLLKGPETLWDAPGMQRIKIPFGGLTPAQMEVLADVADEYADGILHVTTRQDFQLHFVHIDDTPDLMRRLAAVGITTKEACGNVVRNVTCCQVAGVCRTEPFDVTPYADALADFLMGHDDTQDFGRKFKVAFSGCEDAACGLVMLHDLGFVARVRHEDGRAKRGFSVFVGGGLGAVPQQAKLLAAFVPEEEMLPVSQAIARVFARLGEKRNRNQARLKFLITKLGIDAFRRLVFEEREALPYDDRWVSYLDGLAAYREAPARPAALLNGQARPAGFDEWYRTNVYQQRQPGYTVVTVYLPLGDLTSAQMVKLADLARVYAGENVRTTVEQNLVFRWISEADLPALYRDLKAIGLGEPGAGTIVDITSCPGTDTCKLGIASSRGLAGELLTRLAGRSAALPEAVEGLRIKISGCFNSCGQHHVADIGFYGNSRKAGAFRVPYFQVVLGGQWDHNAGSYGLAIGSVPSRSIPDVLEVITGRFAQERTPGERFQAWVGRLGKREARELLRPYMEPPPYEEHPDFYTDWGDPRLYTMDDMGTGECAGEVVSLFSIEVSKAESEAFEAQVALEERAWAKADERAYRAMLMAARALVRTRFPNVGDDPERIVSEFRTRFFDTQLFFDPFAKGKFAEYLFDRHAAPPAAPDADAAHRLVEEAQLFIEAAHACEMRLNQPALPALPAEKPATPLPLPVLPPSPATKPPGARPPGPEGLRAIRAVPPKRPE